MKGEEVAANRQKHRTSAADHKYNWIVKFPYFIIILSSISFSSGSNNYQSDSQSINFGVSVVS